MPENQYIHTGYIGSTHLKTLTRQEITESNQHLSLFFLFLIAVCRFIKFSCYAVVDIKQGPKMLYK